MGNQLVSCISLLILLLIVQAPGNASGEIAGADNVKHAHGHMHMHMHTHIVSQISPSVTVFFLIKDLQVGKTMSIYFSHIDPSKSFHFLPKQQADSIPFSSKALPYLLHFFSFSPDSPQAIAMTDTLSQCEAEVKAKPKSKEVTAPKMMACHNMPYAYAVYLCHAQKTETKVFKVLLEGESGEKVDAVFVCHMDTSKWDQSHVSFALLGVKPGVRRICHFSRHTI
ncbi:hypothetical protein PTKIN_Ptkin10aG0142800 [Pterospermum kingtungense]